MRDDLLGDGELLAEVIATTLAVALVAWHLFGLAVAAAARAWPRRAGLRRLVRWTPAVTRGAVGMAWGASIALTPITGHAAPSPMSSTTVGTTDEPFVRAPVVTDPSTTAAVPAPAAPPPAPVTAPVPVPAPGATPGPESRTHVVQPGDNLWRIAARELARVGGQPDPSDRVIVPYWHMVIDTNRATLRSGDPSLIFPGEIVVLPAP